MEQLPISAEHLNKIKNWLGAGAINIFGLPFAGKDTHGYALSQLFNAPLLGAGDILRNAELDPESKAIIDAGELSPTDTFFKVFTPYLSKSEFDGRPLVLSSVGRWIGEEQQIVQSAADAGHPIKAVVYLHLDEDIVHRRFEKSQQTGDRGDRADDVAHKLETRIQEFNAKTLPVIEVYRDLGLLIEINSDAEKSEVLRNILSRLLMAASNE